MAARRGFLACSLALGLARIAEAAQGVDRFAGAAGRDRDTGSADRDRDAGPAGRADEYGEAKRRMLADIDGAVQRTASSTGVRRLSDPVRRAIAEVPRHRFVPPPWNAFAYADRPLPIGQGQTISQPFVVALMTQMLDPQPADRVLEVGTGSGYQAAVLARLVARVYTIEIVQALGERAAALLRELGYDNVEVRIGDGYQGWPDRAPFDGIVVTAAPETIPGPLIDQLAPGGRLVAPIGPQGGIQDLLLLRKDADGRTVTRRLLPVRFVPLTRERQ